MGFLVVHFEYHKCIVGLGNLLLILSHLFHIPLHGLGAY
jgi:hypothetical protein